MGPIWMMHLAVNLYNEQGMFADVFPLVNYFSLLGSNYTFFGEKVI